ncbi:alpha/beta fold hydrolase [Actinacidiphila sp. ITFR-21]|uniref:alpha/beta fold hydrolase n=1 Tax=Actinacidiphila sp. ITFR-21 TaxID=3075199 RepID=UPI0028897762|nr:alpha/beta fold hydrolase [Streptomyces sp. ITFR-21]WNI16056.1 alpha/beta fold hydrolase [Streptomyces sp. ITFR-21]
MLELKRVPRNVRREIITIRRGDVRLSLHVWRPDRPKAAVFYFQGLQSHSGWLWEAGPRFADNDVAFFMLDRRGTGSSDGERQTIPPVETLVADYVAALTRVRETIGDEMPLGLFGHCLGGSFMAALMHHPDFAVPYDAAVFCSTWLGKLHATLTGEQFDALARETGTELWDAGLRAADFTADPKYQRFIEHDDLATRQLTRRSRRTLLELEGLYMSPRRTPPAVPTAFVSGIKDPIVDLGDAHATFIKVTDGRGLIIQLPTDRHYLFFTGVRDYLIDWSSTFVLMQGLEQHG